MLLRKRRIRVNQTYACRGCSCFGYHLSWSNSSKYLECLAPQSPRTDARLGSAQIKESERLRRHRRRYEGETAVFPFASTNMCFRACNTLSSVRYKSLMSQSYRHEEKEGSIVARAAIYNMSRPPIRGVA